MTIWLADTAAIKTVLIPAGQFTMGSAEREKGRGADEGPRHVVCITRPFHMSAHEVTRGQFAAFVKDSGYLTDAERQGWAYAWNGTTWGRVNGACWRRPGFEQTDDHPVTEVSYDDAVAFCKWFSSKRGVSVRLPTEAEWEYACRSGTTTPFAAGETIDTNQANFNGGPEGEYRRGTTAVGRFAPNAWGLYDMHGNVWEWCSDWYADCYSAASRTDPAGPAAGANRVLRGGSWFNPPSLSRSAARNKFLPGLRNVDIGFRIVVDSDLRPAKMTRGDLLNLRI